MNSQGSSSSSHHEPQEPHELCLRELAQLSLASSSSPHPSSSSRPSLSSSPSQPSSASSSSHPFKNDSNNDYTLFPPQHDVPNNIMNNNSKPYHVSRVPGQTLGSCRLDSDPFDVALQEALRIMSSNDLINNNNNYNSNNNLMYRSTSPDDLGYVYGYGGEVNRSLNGGYNREGLVDVDSRSGHRNNYRRGSNGSRNSLPRNNGNSVHRDALFSWEDLKGNVGSLAKDKLGSKVLQGELDILPTVVIKLMLCEVMQDVNGIMMNYHGSEFVQSLLDYCDDCDYTYILRVVMSSVDQFFNLAVDHHGTRVMQRLAKGLNSTNLEQRFIVRPVLRAVAVALAMDTGGYHALEEFLKAFRGANEVILPIAKELNTRVVDIAMDKSGCCALQNIAPILDGPIMHTLMNTLLKNTVILADDHFGNYVVQYMIKNLDYAYTQGIIARLQGKFAYLSSMKFSSFVVEKCLTACAECRAIDHFNLIVEEISAGDKFLELLQDRHGNYVVQAALKISKEYKLPNWIYDKLARRVQNHYASLRSNPFGKNVLSCINKYSISKPYFGSMI